MASDKTLKFYKKSTAPSGAALGSVWFDTANRLINVKVADSGDKQWESYSGLQNATWVEDSKTLRLVKADGTNLDINLSDVASASALTLVDGRLGDVENWKTTADSDITTLKTNVGNLQTEAGKNTAKLADITEGQTVKAVIDAAVKEEADRAKGIEGDHATRIDNLDTKVNTNHEGRIAELENKFTGEGSVASQIEDAVEAAEGRIQAKLDKKVETSEYNEYKTTNDAAVGQISTDLSGEITARETLEGEFDGHVADNVRHITADERAAWNEAKADIDAFMASADAGEAAIDTLKEIQNFLSSDNGTVQTLLDEVAENKAAIATLNGTEAGSVKKAAADAQAAAETTAKNYTDAREVEIKKYADQAEADAVATAAADATSKANAAKDAAIAAAATDAQTKANAAQAAAEATAAADAATKAAGALADAKAYTDAEIAKLDAEVTSDDKYATVKVTEVDGKLTDVEVTITPGEVSAGSADALVTAASVKSYVDAQVSGSWTWEEFN